MKERCRKHGFSEASYYLWRSKFGGMKVSAAKRLKELGVQLRASRTRTHTSNRLTATCGGIPLSEDGTELKKIWLDSSWQRFMTRAIKMGVVAAEDRFGMLDLKRKGITATVGTLADKQHARSHKTESMMDVYDLSRPIVNPSKHVLILRSILWLAKKKDSR